MADEDKDKTDKTAFHLGKMSSALENVNKGINTLQENQGKIFNNLGVMSTQIALQNQEFKNQTTANNGRFSHVERCLKNDKRKIEDLEDNIEVVNTEDKVEIASSEKSKKYIAWIISIILFIVMCGNGFMWWRNNKKIDPVVIESISKKLVEDMMKKFKEKEGL